MGRILALALAIAIATVATSALADEIKIKNVRPSRLVGQLVAGKSDPRLSIYEVTSTDTMPLIPKGVKLRADDERSVIDVEGSKSQVATVTQLIALFDVKPVTVHAEIELNVPLEKYKSSTTTDIRNQSVWKLSDQAANMSLGITPRVNEDGTITLHFIVGDGEAGYQMVVRIKQDQSVEIPIDGVGGIRIRDFSAKEEKDPNIPFLRLKLTVVNK